MTYHNNKELPKGVKEHLPEHAQDIYREAYNHSYEQYINPEKRKGSSDSLEKIAHKVAWSAVKKKYQKGVGGDWHVK